uniref:Guanine nucleotide-binding protein subunit beta-like protein n=1 Tax=Eutreptiella gymnastica TaxID=73025 RepID=A0A7S4CXK8_9EUGL|mmetsp:Transcript_57294/g.94220  ORF Transcript_57294/g.94220 Transcript_57294/m.94220 type:complete len:511 (+) Transcript_57294:50-1582(+)
MMNMNPIRMHADPREARPEPVKRARFDESMGRYLGKPVDFYSSIITRQKMRLYLSPRDDPLVVQPSEYHAKDMLPTSALVDRAITSVCTNWVHSYNGYRKRSPVLTCLWTPEGRRLMTGNKQGEVAVLNGFAFNSLHQFSAHTNTAVQSMVWAREGDFMLTGSPDGWVTVWQSSMVSVKEQKCHDDSVQQISISPTDSKFATASADGSLKIWDLETITMDTGAEGSPELVLSGHGNKVNCCDWHPQYSLLASGSNDKLVKLWDPRVSDGRQNHCLNNLLWHRNTVLKVKWNPRIGHQLLSCGKDYTIKLTDIRMMQELYTFDGHKRDVTCIDWHPCHPDLFVSGCADGGIGYWIVGYQDRSAPGHVAGVNKWTNKDKNHGKETCRMVAEVPQAHVTRQLHPSVQVNSSVWDVKWHPLGHMVASVGNDIFCKIWGRSKPGQAADTKEYRPPQTTYGFDERPQFQNFRPSYPSNYNRYNTGPQMLRPGYSTDSRPKDESGKMVVTFNDDDED